MCSYRDYKNWRNKNPSICYKVDLKKLKTTANGEVPKYSCLARTQSC